MEVRVIHTTEHREPKKVNIPATAALGGLTGYALKYALPLDMMKEVNDYTNGEYTNIIKKSGADARSAELAEIKKLAQKNPNYIGADVFTKLFSESAEEQNLAKKAFRDGSKELRAKVKELGQRIGNKSKVARSSTEYILKASTKNARPTSVYVVPGIVLGLVGAFVYNVIGSFRD